MKRLTCLCLVVLLLASAAPARADIFQWEYINPGNPSLGKQASTTLCVEGAGQNAEPNGYLYGDLTMAYLIGTNLTHNTVEFATLIGADLSQANLSGTTLYGVDFTNANLSQANLTVDYLDTANFTGANLSQANLTNVSFGSFDPLTNANLNQANLANARFFGTDLTNANLSHADLTNAYFSYAALTGADLTGAKCGGPHSAATLTVERALLRPNSPLRLITKLAI